MPSGTPAAAVKSHRPPSNRSRIAIRAGVAAAVLAGAVLVVKVVSRVSCDDPTTAVVAASSAHFQVLDSLAKQWTDSACLAVTVVRKSAGEVAAALGPTWDAGRDGQRPDVWAPESSLWLLVAQGWPGSAATVPVTAPSLATSPMVLALRQEMAHALGWPGRELGWEDVVGAISQPEAWAAAGHPEWATRKLGVADPAASAMGLAMVVAMLDPDSDGTVTDAELGAAVVFSQTLGAMEADTSVFFAQAGDAGSAIAAFPAAEQDLVNNPNQTLVPIYPRQYSIMADFPYAVLTADWVDEGRREAATRFLEFARGPDGRAAFGAAGFRGADGAVLEGAKFAAAQGFRQTLPPARPMPSAATLGQVIGIWTAVQRPANTLVLLDTSGSMNQLVPGTRMTRLQLMQQTAAAGFGMLTNRTSIGLWQFSSRLTPATDYRILVPFGPIAESVGPGSRGQALHGSLAGLQASGGTGLYDTIYAAFTSMQAAWQPDSTNVVLVITDGRNEDDAGLNLEELLARLTSEGRPDRPLPIIGIAVGPEADAAALGEISQVTGGRTFVVRDPANAVNTLVLAFAGRLR